MDNKSMQEKELGVSQNKVTETDVALIETRRKLASAEQQLVELEKDNRSMKTEIYERELAHENDVRILKQERDEILHEMEKFDVAENEMQES